MGEWTGPHNVYMFPDKAAFDACDFSKAAMIGDQSGTVFDIPNTAGQHEGDIDTLYFACQVTGHCAAGQKIAVSVKLPKFENPEMGTDGKTDGGKMDGEHKGEKLFDTAAEAEAA